MITQTLQKAARSLLLIAVMTACTFMPASAAAETHCCEVTAITPDGQVTAAERNGTRKIQFRVADRALLRKLRAGSPVYANFENGQVSLDGRKTCCTIQRIAGASPPASTAAPVVRPAPATAARPAPTRTPAPAAPEPAPGTAAAAPQEASKPSKPIHQEPATQVTDALAAMPQLSLGAAQQLPPADWRSDSHQLRRYQPKNLLQLHGDVGIKQASGLPQAVKDALWLHARTLEAQELDSYIVIPEQAQAWANELPSEMRDLLRKAATDDGKKKAKGCSTKHISTGCAKNEVKQAVDDLTKAAQRAWSDTVDEWGRLMGRIEEVRQCFKERTLSARGPVQLGIEPQIPLSFEHDSTSNSKSGSASGHVQGNVNVSLPIKAGAMAQIDVFYIPCLPFAIRPRSLGADGQLSVEGIFNASLDATGAFDRLFAVPPVGGIQIPVAIIPIALGNVPIAVIDVSVFLEGSLRIDGEGALNGKLTVQSLQESDFRFSCSGHGCTLEPRAVPTPANAVQSMKLDGRIRLRPAIYSALQLGLNYDVLKARAGPQPFLLGEISGCFAADAAQSTTGASSAEGFHALTADLDWGIELRAEALAGGQKVAGKKWLMQQQHLYFKDLGHSTALVPAISGVAEASAGQSAAFALKMPKCYPYTDAVQYLVQWTGNAGTTESAALRTTALRAALPVRSPPPANTKCTWGSGQGSCRGTPFEDTPFQLIWPASGDYVLTVSSLEDAHGRKFDSARSSEWPIRISP